MPVCAFCGKELQFEDKVFRTMTCDHCDADLHCCLQCAHYNPGRQNECKEPMAENVERKDKANYCGYFVFGANFQKNDAAKSALRELDSLFGHPVVKEAEPPKKPPKDLDDLFKNKD